jgi:hypothetical protein
MATMKEYFAQHPGLATEANPNLVENGEPIDVIMASVKDIEAAVQYLRIYIGECTNPVAILAHLLEKCQSEIDMLMNGLRIEMQMGGANDLASSSDMVFSGRIVVYTPTEVPLDWWEHLKVQLKARGLSLIVRDSTYGAARQRNERPKAFLSHDTRDKDEFVRPLANRLSSMLCPVWYDEYSLVPGQSLRENIERGIKECDKCIIVLSDNFFNNRGWSAREFESIYQKEILYGKRYMIPIWLGVDKQKVFEYSPILLDTLGISAELGVDEVATRIIASIARLDMEGR